MISRGKAAARRLVHARVLLQADASEGGPDWTDTRIAEAVRVSVRTIGRVRQRFVEDGLEAALRPKPSPRVSRASWTARRRRSCWLWPARGRLRAGGVGHCGSW